MIVMMSGVILGLRRNSWKLFQLHLVMRIVWHASWLNLPNWSVVPALCIKQIMDQERLEFWAFNILTLIDYPGWRQYNMKYVFRFLQKMMLFELCA